MILLCLGEFLNAFRRVDAARGQEIPHFRGRVGNIVAEWIDVPHRTEQETLHRALAGEDVHDALGLFDDVEHPAHIHAGFLDVADVVECPGQPAISCGDMSTLDVNGLL